MDTVVSAVEGPTTLITALTWTSSLTISNQHAPLVVAGAGAQGRSCKLVKPTTTAETDAEPARTKDLQYPKSATVTRPTSMID